MRRNGSGRRDAAVAALLAFATLAYLWPLRAFGFMLNDDGWYLHPTVRMLDGEILYRDIWTFYAPFEYHLLAWLFRLGEPSILLARSLWIVLLVGAVVGTYFVARRLAPPGVAWLPAMVFALVPGQWSKAFYSVCTVAFLLAAAAVLDRPRPRRFFVLGLAVGFSVIARQDLGFLQLLLAGAIAAVLWLRPAAFGDAAADATRRGASRVFALVAGAAVVVAPVLVYYGAHGALADLVDATLIRGVAQRKGWYAPGLAALFSWSKPLAIAEGRFAGALLLAPLLVYAAAGLLLCRRLLQKGLGPQRVFAGLLLAYALAGLANTYYQMRLLRLLETGIPFYLITTWLVVESTRAVRRPQRAAGVALAGLAGLYLATTLVFVPHFLPGEDYSGSLRMRRFDRPVTLLGDRLFVSPEQAEELWLLRAFVDAKTRPGDPIFVVPLQSLYYELLQRPNPTRIVAIHFREDHVLTDEQKQEELRKLRASGARYAIVDRTWFAWHEPPDPIRRALLEEFHPIRGYGEMLVLERNRDARDRRVTEAYGRLAQRGVSAERIAELEALVREFPDEPLPWSLLGFARLALDRAGPAADAFDRAAALDPVDPTALEYAAQALASIGQRAAAAERLRRAAAVRENRDARARPDPLGR